MAEVRNCVLDRKLSQLAIAVTATVVVFLLRLGLSSALGADLPPYITFYPAVMVVALVCGAWAGLLSTGLGILLANYFIVSPHHLLRVDNAHDLAALVVFGGMGVFMSLVAEFYRKARSKAAEYENELSLRETQQALRESEGRWAATLKSIGDAVVTCDVAGEVTFLNPEAEALTEWKMAEALGKPIREIFRIENEVTGAPCEDLVAKVLREKRTFGLANHTALVSKDGRKIPIEDSAAPITDGEGQVIGVVLVFHDVAERRNAQRLLEASEERYRGLVELSPVAILVNRNNQFEFANPAACHLFGAKSPEQLLGKTPYELFHAECHEVIRERIRCLLEGTRPPLIEEKIVRLDGMLRDVEVIACDFADQQGPAIQVLLRDVTEAKQAEKVIRRYQLLSSHSRDAILFLSANDGRILEANDAALAIYGYTREELQSFTIYELRAPHTRAMIASHMAQAQMAGVQFETVHQRKDGRLFPAEISSQGVTNEGVPTLISVIRDISERKDKEEQLKTLNRTLNALKNSNQALIHATDESSLLHQVCKIVTENCGHAMVWIGYAEDDSRKAVRPVAHEGFEAGYLETLNVSWGDSERGRGPTGMAIRSGRTCTCRNMLTDPSFEPWREEAFNRGYASSLALPLIANGKVFGAITIYSKKSYSFSQDEVKLLEELAADLSTGISALRLREAHRKAEEALRSNEARLRLALEAAKSGTWQWDLVNDQLIWSDEMWELFGLERGSCIPSSEAWFSTIHPQDREMAEKTLRQAAEFGTDFHLEYRVLDRNGGTRTLLVRGRPLGELGSQPVSLVGIVMDISARKRAQEALIRSEKLASVGRMAATVAHEINNPLEAVMNLVYLAWTDPTLSKDAKAHLDAASQELERVAHLTKQTLGFYRETAAPSLVDLGENVDSVINIFAPRLRSKGIIVEKRYSSARKINAVTGEVRQIVTNLLSNSLDAVGKNGTIHVRVGSLARADGTKIVRFTIADTGGGITAERLPKVFEPFFTTKEAVGTGLGLWVTKELVQKHAGSIRVRSKPGRGTVFSVCFPLCQSLKGRAERKRDQTSEAVN